jgi:OmpA-OmpF porin, OOP family
MKKTIIAIAAASAFVASAAAMATAPVAPRNAGEFYVNGNVGYGHTALNKTDITLDAGQHIKKNGFAWSANVGYQFNPNFAVELGYMDLYGYKVTQDNVATSVKLEGSAITAAAKVIYPVSQEFDLFGKLGFAYESSKAVVSDGTNSATVKSTDHPVTPLLGLGVDYNVNSNVAITVQGITTLRHNANYPATYTGLVGLTYKFS